MIDNKTINAIKVYVMRRCVGGFYSIIEYWALKQGYFEIINL
jgi:hypothetical protein